jgi:hypothetical protein
MGGVKPSMSMIRRGIGECQGAKGLAAKLVTDASPLE